MRIGPRVGMLLSCHIEREYQVTAVVYNSWTDYYGVQTVWVDRPAEGVRSGRLRAPRVANWLAFGSTAKRAPGRASGGGWPPR
jgi:hypothetical protein